MFFDFLLIGDKGSGVLIKNADGWTNPDRKPVTVVTIEPGDGVTLKLKNAFSMQQLGIGEVFGERYKLVLIYRDYAYGFAPRLAKGHAPLWKGMVMSPPIPLRIRVSTAE